MKLATGWSVIENGSLVDGTGKPAIKAGAVVIQDGVIVYAGEAESMPVVPPDALRIDAKGGTIMPGLVEAHFHATYFNVHKLEDLDIKISGRVCHAACLREQPTGAGMRLHGRHVLVDVCSTSMSGSKSRSRMI